MKVYNHHQIEKKWQDLWEKEQAFYADINDEKEKFYALVEFPYPSGAGLHVGHLRAYTSLEIIARKRRLEGYNVLFPIGFDAFGLPTENYAIKTGRHPRDVTDENIKIFSNQLKAVGYSFDWDKVIDTTDPNYYKWTQWIFLKLFENGLAYRDRTYVNFCTQCQVVLANEDFREGKCDRCGSDVIQLEKDVWFLKIRDYAERLLQGLDEVDYLPRIRLEQENWIGKSVGAEVDFGVTGWDKKLRVFTTRPDTLFGATFMVIAPEHPLIEEMHGSLANIDEIKEYRHQAQHKTEFERVQLAKEKTGVLIKGVAGINPLTKEEIPIFVADYVMMGYGTGAIMAVPGHDTRDWDFAKKYNLPIIEVIQSDVSVQEEAYVKTDSGIMVNSGFLNGLEVKEAIEKTIEYLESEGLGEKTVNYKMKDWAFNRQRYWGEPIPIVHCPTCGMVPVPYEELPLELPKIDSYEPTSTGESPLSEIGDWVETICPKCGGHARRETDTMPQWAGSSWYFLRYFDNKNNDALASEEKMKYWQPVDWYNGGMEHVTRHLLYSRFWYQFLFDIGVVPTREPYTKRTAQGMILGADGEKMSKSKGNVVNPTDIIEEMGADALRTYVMFIGDYEKAAPWSDSGSRGCKRYLDRVFRLQDDVIDSDEYRKELELSFHKTIKKVTSDYENMKFNTAIASLMGLLNDINKAGKVTKGEFKTYLQLLYPVAPHITEELWEIIGCKGYLHNSTWPQYDEAKTIEDQIEMAVQVNGKVRGKIVLSINASKDEAKKIALNNSAILQHVDGKNIVKEIFVPGKIFNLVVK